MLTALILLVAVIVSCHGTTTRQDYIIPRSGGTLELSAIHQQYWFSFENCVRAKRDGMEEMEQCFDDHFNRFVSSDAAFLDRRYFYGKNEAAKHFKTLVRFVLNYASYVTSPPYMCRPNWGNVVYLVSDMLSLENRTLVGGKPILVQRAFRNLLVVKAGGVPLIDFYVSDTVYAYNTFEPEKNVIHNDIFQFDAVNCKLPAWLEWCAQHRENCDGAL